MRVRSLAVVPVLCLVAAACGEDGEGDGANQSPSPTEQTNSSSEDDTEPSGDGESQALELGTSVDFADWNIGIMKVTRDDGIAPYEPEPGIEYAGFRVELTGTYAGEGDSSIEIDFTIKHVGTDNRVYADFDSHHGNAEPLKTGPNVVAGGTQTVEFSLAVPTSALGGNGISLESWAGPDEGPSWNAGI